MVALFSTALGAPFLYTVFGAAMVVVVTEGRRTRPHAEFRGGGRWHAMRIGGFP